MSDKKIGCRTPNPEKEGVTNIPEWKFNAVRNAILKSLRHGPILFSDLPKMVANELTPEEASSLGSIGWHATTVKLELEVRGEIERVSGRSPQEIRLKNPTDG